MNVLAKDVSDVWKIDTRHCKYSWFPGSSYGESFLILTSNAAFVENGRTYETDRLEVHLDGGKFELYANLWRATYSDNDEGCPCLERMEQYVDATGLRFASLDEVESAITLLDRHPDPHLMTESAWG